MLYTIGKLTIFSFQGYATFKNPSSRSNSEQLVEDYLIHGGGGAMAFQTFLTPSLKV